MAARLGRRAWMLVWGAVAVVVAAVLTVPAGGSACGASDDCAAETISVVGMPTNWSVFGIVVVLALSGIYLTLHRKAKAAEQAAD